MGSVAVLFEPFRSVVSLVTVAVLERSATWEMSTWTVTVTEVEAPLPTVPRAHATVPPDSVPPPVAETKVVPAGTGSEMATLDASEGPALETPIVYVRSVPAVTGSTESVFVMERSALVATAVGSVAESFVPSGSRESEDTVAVFERSAARAGSTCTVTVTASVSPFASVPIFHVTTPPDSVPPTVAETKVAPAGSGSEMRTLAALEGPALWTVIV